MQGMWDYAAFAVLGSAPKVSDLRDHGMGGAKGISL